MGFLSKLPKFKPTKKTAYYFYRPLTKRWNKSPSVTIYGLDGEELIITFNKGRLTIENTTHITTSGVLKGVVQKPQDLFSVFNNFLGDAHTDGVIKGPVNGGPIYLSLQNKWTMTSDVCRDFLEDVWHALEGEKISFAF